MHPKQINEAFVKANPAIRFACKLPDIIVRNAPEYLTSTFGLFGLQLTINNATNINARIDFIIIELKI